MTNHCAWLDTHGVQTPRWADLDVTAFILILLADNPLSTGYLSGGRKKDSWIIRLPKGVEGYSWGKGGEEGDESGRSVKSESDLFRFSVARMDEDRGRR